jgi:hypothetical protein
VATSYVEPGSPWENPFVESFNGRLRDKLLNMEEFVKAARKVVRSSMSTPARRSRSWST